MSGHPINDIPCAAGVVGSLPRPEPEPVRDMFPDESGEECVTRRDRLRWTR